ncbi:MAG: mannose-1-phosphate guanylyltransferase/mannose-6-phosphate isomerase [Magnetococcales bacterium]|nr:mannose-1-phosphate guanylyltransferase/mannose-6-phosphate isomerase [Magnetococcales bacterium]
MAVVPVILSGGSGTRLWPLSRKSYPKQYLKLVDGKTLFENTLERIKTLPNAVEPILVCNQDHRFLSAEQVRNADMTAAAIILEPFGRNTAPAVACAALEALKRDEQAILLVLPADHLIQDVDAFHQAVALGATQAVDGKLVTFGIVPTKPETGYGYIKRGDALADTDTPVFKVDRFVEKPQRETAEAYLNSGDYYWNSGMFLFRADRYLEILNKFTPEMVSACQKAMDDAQQDLDFLRLDEHAFAACPSDSIDYAVMEKTDSGVVVPLSANWNDIGAWSALWEVGDQDDDGNVTKGDVIAKDSRGCYIHGSDRLVATVGLQDHIVVDTADAIFIAPRDRAQDVKMVVKELETLQRSEPLHHSRVYRPWGSYETLALDDRFQVKRIVVNPGGVLSLQKHHHRAEHWIVVSGTAIVTRGEDELMLTEDQSTYIPLGTVHRLENPGKIPLTLIEVQTGSYLGEDDIVRLDDQYGRAPADKK